MAVHICVWFIRPTAFMKITGVLETIYICVNFELITLADCSSMFSKSNYVSSDISLELLRSCLKDVFVFHFCYMIRNLVNHVASIFVSFCRLINYVSDNICWILQYFLEVSFVTQNWQRHFLFFSFLVKTASEVETAFPYWYILQLPTFEYGSLVEGKYQSENKSEEKGTDEQPFADKSPLIRCVETYSAR